MNCSATNRRGQPCAMAAQRDREFCFIHDPAKARDRAEARRLGGRRRQTTRGAAPPESVSLRRVAEILELLETVTVDTLRQENSAQRSRAVVALAGLALKAVEVGELEERVAALEART